MVYDKEQVRDDHEDVRCSKFEYTSHIKQVVYKVVICYCDLWM